MAIEWPRALRILALKEALSTEPSHDYFIRKVFRWYSKTFSTPLHQVYDLPLFDVMQAYYDESYANLADEKESPELHEELSTLSKSEDELEQEKLSKDKEEVELWLMDKSMASDNKQDVEKAALQKKKIAEEKLRRDRETAKQIDALLGKDALGSYMEPKASAKAKEFKPEPPEIKMSFTGLDDIGELDGLTAFGV
jgi:primosomal protein N'